MEMGAGGPPGGVPPQQPGGYPPQPQQQQYAQQPYGQQGGGGGAAEAAQQVQRAIRTPETKPFFLTSEFLVWLITIVALVIAGAVVSEGDNGDTLPAGLVWTLFTVISFAYIISRGISKAGAKYGDRGGHGGGGNW